MKMYYYYFIIILYNYYYYSSSSRLLNNIIIYILKLLLFIILFFFLLFSSHYYGIFWFSGLVKLTDRMNEWNLVAIVSVRWETDSTVPTFQLWACIWNSTLEIHFVNCDFSRGQCMLHMAFLAVIVYLTICYATAYTDRLEQNLHLVYNEQMKIPERFDVWDLERTLAQLGTAKH